MRQGEGLAVFVEEQASESARRISVEAELRALLDSVDQGVLLFDNQGNLRSANLRFGQLMNLEPGALAAARDRNSLAKLLKGCVLDGEAFAQAWQALQEGGEEAGWTELELARPARRVVERFARPVFGPDGQRVGWLELYREITRDRLTPSRLLQTEKLAELGQMVSGIAHELNNPLTGIMGYAQLLLSRGTDRAGMAGRRSDARKIFMEAQRATAIVRNLLLFARHAEPERALVDLNHVVESTLALCGYELKVQNVAVSLELAADLPSTLGDAHQLQQVVLNLVVNAKQAIAGTGRGGRIRIRTYAVPPSQIVLEISDDGPGIPPEISSRIFDPFFTTKAAGVGTGLGLSIVFGIVEQHGGEIRVHSVSGRGATFVIELPVASREEGVSAGAIAAGPSQKERRGTRRALGHRILVIEDEPTVAQLIADYLGSEGFDVEAVQNSPEGLERILIASPPYDLVICDLRMPHLDGPALYRRLELSGNPARRKMLFVTGDTLGRRTLGFLEKNCLPHLAKPFLVEELKNAVQLCLHKNERAARPTHRARQDTDTRAKGMRAGHRRKRTP